MTSPPRHLARLALFSIAALAQLTACGDSAAGGEGGTASEGAARVGGQVVSTVDGHPITVAQIRELAQAGGLSPRDALRRLQAELLLMAEAERRGYAEHAPVFGVGQRALVHAVLDQEAAAQEVPQEELRRRYEAAGKRFSSLEQRSSLHVLAQLDEGATAEQERAAKAFAESMVERLRTEAEPEALIEELHREERDGYTVVVQKLPSVPPTVAFEKPYLDAMFSTAVAGVVPKVARTSFGWHAITVLEITPERSTSFEDASPELLKEALLDARTEGVHGLLERLRSDNGVVVNEGAREAMASLKP